MQTYSHLVQGASGTIIVLDEVAKWGMEQWRCMGRLWIFPIQRLVRDLSQGVAGWVGSTPGSRLIPITRMDRAAARYYEYKSIDSRSASCSLMTLDRVVGVVPVHPKPGLFRMEVMAFLAAITQMIS
jgi:hypothetical protein